MERRKRKSCDSSTNQLPIGTKVMLVNTGSSYPDIQSIAAIHEAIKRFKPCNVDITKLSSGKIEYHIKSGFATPSDLSKRKDLTWKIVYKYPIYYITLELFIILSNQRHILVVTKNAIKPLPSN